MDTFTPRLTPSVHGARKYGRKRVSELHRRARARMERRARMHNWTVDVHDVFDRLGPMGRSLSKASKAAEDSLEQLYEEAKALETALWNAYPACPTCEGRKVMRILTSSGETEKECSDCDGSGVDRRG